MVNTQAKHHLSQYHAARDKLSDLLEKGYPYAKLEKDKNKERLLITDLIRQMKDNN